MLGMSTPLTNEEHQYSKVSPTRPHIKLDTVIGTGTRPPSSCGKKPKAIGQSVMLLPENPLRSTTHVQFYMKSWLIRAAINHSGGRTAVVVGDGNADHMAKGCRLGRLLILLTKKRRKARGILC
jgi:hypothetical protein